MNEPAAQNNLLSFPTADVSLTERLVRAAETFVECALRLVRAVETIAECALRFADALAPAPTDIVGTPYIANLLGFTTTYISEMARDGLIPEECIAKRGNGTQWKFFRGHVDVWLAARGQLVRAA